MKPLKAVSWPKTLSEAKRFLRYFKIGFKSHQITLKICSSVPNFGFGMVYFLILKYQLPPEEFLYIHLRRAIKTDDVSGTANHPT